MEDWIHATEYYVGKALMWYIWTSYGVPIHYLWGKISDSSKKQSVLSELKGKYTDNQAHGLMIAI